MSANAPRSYRLIFLCLSLLIILKLSFDWEAAFSAVNPSGSSGDPPSGDDTVGKSTHHVIDEHADSFELGLLEETAPIREDFISATSTTSIREFNPVAIQEQCANKRWPNDLVFQCDWIVGGVGNVRQEIFACLRWAIESGAAFIIPSLFPRKASKHGEGILNEWDEPINLDILFDVAEFVSRIHEACPQMAVYDNVKAIPGPGRVQDIGKLHPTQLQKTWSEWISEHRARVGDVSLLTFSHTLAEYEVCHDNVEFVHALGQLLPFRHDVHRIAATVLYELSRRYNLGLSSAASIVPDKFLGIHLRTSADAVEQGWMDYQSQSTLYLQFAATYALPIVYVASGNSTSISMFSNSIAPTPVVTKFSLLGGDDLAQLQGMNWDQQGMVDYLVLLKASRFLGMSESSFSWNIAVERRAVGERGTCGQNHSNVVEREGDLNSELAFEDELSVIIGKPNGYDFGARFWP